MLNLPKIQKKKLHPRNKHIEGYDFDKLILFSPELTKFVKINPSGNPSINFADPLAVKTLNKALLKTYYSIRFWDIPRNNLCPPIPGRADYIHYIADILAENYKGIIPHGAEIKILDIGVGANCIYPIIGSQEYGWSFVGTDSSKQAVKSAREIVAGNHSLDNLVSIRFQSNKAQIFKDCLLPGEFYHFVICNPPFYSSAAEAVSKTVMKLKNLGKDKKPSLVQNFGGKDNELWTKDICKQNDF
jgi:23S rRNA (adenine1618-N6)-methyltransferase